MAADQYQWRAVCGSKMPNATKETPTSERQDIWHHNHEKFLFLTVLLLFAQFKMHYW
jgi:hypothetical protein